MATPEQKLQSQIQRAVQDYLQATQDIAIATVQRAFAISSRPNRARTVQQGRSRSSASKGQKRNPAVLQALTAQLQELIQQQPGLTMQALAQKMEQSTTDLSVPANRLKRQGIIKTVGQRNQTAYFPRPQNKKVA